MRIGVFNQTVNDGTIDEVVEHARRAEADGFASFWTSHILGHDALTALAVVGREVPRIELGTSVVPTFPRHPAALAQQAVTVNAIAGGRLCLGIGLSHKVVIESMYGLRLERAVRHLTEYLDVLRPLSEDRPAAVDGELYRVHLALSAKGASPFPIVVAALGPQLLRVAGERADGTVTWLAGPATLADHIVPTITAAAEAAGRPAPRILAALPVCVTTEAAAVRDRVTKRLGFYAELPSYRAMLDREGAAGPADVAIAGSADEVEEQIRALGAIGVTDFAAVEMGANPDEVDATRALLRSLLDR